MIPLGRLRLWMRHTIGVDYPVDADAGGSIGARPYPLDWRRLADGPRHAAQSPIGRCLAALADHSTYWHSDDSRALADFLASADALLASQNDRGGWKIMQPVRRYATPAGWHSGMAQGLGVSVLTRAYHLTGDGRYTAGARGAGDLLVASLESGGCSDYDSVGRPFFEECPSAPRSGVLNGALFALVAAIEAPDIINPTITAAALDRLSHDLPMYESHSWSRYDLWYSAPASYAYHSLHVSQLTAISRLTSDPSYLVIARRWDTWGHNPRLRLRAAISKAVFALTHRR